MPGDGAGPPAHGIRASLCVRLGGWVARWRIRRWSGREDRVLRQTIRPDPGSAMVRPAVVRSRLVLRRPLHDRGAAAALRPASAATVVTASLTRWPSRAPAPDRRYMAGAGHQRLPTDSGNSPAATRSNVVLPAPLVPSTTHTDPSPRTRSTGPSWKRTPTAQTAPSRIKRSEPTPCKEVCRSVVLSAIGAIDG
jgi:hypothetical protein